jgi:lipid A disaccharide synthetase
LPDIFESKADFLMGFDSPEFNEACALPLKRYALDFAFEDRENEF